MEPNATEAVEYLDTGAASFVGLMDDLTTIRGYQAAAIMASDGELLYSNTRDLAPNFDLNMTIKVLDGFFGKACDITEKSGFVACTEVSLRTGQEVMVVRCSGKDCLVGIRLFVLVEEQGNVALMQSKLRHLLPLIMRCLTWDPDNLVPLYMREAAWRQTGEPHSQPGMCLAVN